MTHDYYEYEQGQKDIFVKGRLRKKFEFWKNIGASKFILDTILYGYNIPFYSLPTRSVSNNNRSAINEYQFVSDSIKNLLDRNLIQKCDNLPYVVNPLSVSVRDTGKKRLILDLRIVNKHVWKQSVKYDDIKIALSFLEKDHWMVKYDIHSAYHFVDIYPPHTDFLGFSWNDVNGNVSYFKFLVLPFGLSSSPYIFSKLTRPLITKWRGEGKRVLMFLDDGFGCDTSFDETTILGSCIKEDLIRSGFVPKVEKCIWIPVQNMQFLGCDLNSDTGIINIPSSKVKKALQTIDSFISSIIKHRRVHVKMLASFVGQIISMSTVLGPISQIMTRYLSMDISSALSWHSYVKPSKQSMLQINFWKNNLSKLNGRNIFQSRRCTKIVYSDASQTGFAGYEVHTLNSVSHGVWSAQEAHKSSTWRELMAVNKVLQSLSHILNNQQVKWFTDNSAVSIIVKKGSMNVELQNIAIDIFIWCMENSTTLDIEWIPRSKNEKSDYLSRIIEVDDWGISPQILKLLQQKWGLLEVDWFASHHNAKLPLFYSRFWNPESAGVDAFTEYWGGKYGLFVPPIRLISRVILKIISDSTEGVLIIPLWKSANFWPMLCPNGRFVSYIINWIDLPTNKQSYVSCKNGKGIFGNQDLDFRMIALRFSCKK